MPLWNELRLCAPHGDFCTYNIKNNSEKLLKVAEILVYGSEKIAMDAAAWAEIKLFDPLKRRLALKLAADKFLQFFERIGTCLKHLTQMNLPKSYLDLAEIFLSEMAAAKSASVKLPSRQQLEFLLIRTQGYAKLICQTLSYCDETFVFVLQKLSVGHMTHCMLLAASVVARISIIFKALLVHLCDLYKEIKPLCDFLERGSWLWPSDPELPDDLKKWIDPDEIILKCEDTKVPSHLEFLQNIFKPDVDNLGDKCGHTSQNNADPALELDLGEVQVRREFDREDCMLPVNGGSEEDDANAQSSDSENDLPQKQPPICEAQLRLSKKKTSSSMSNFLKVIREANSLKLLSSVARNMVRHSKLKDNIQTGSSSVFIYKIKCTYQKLKFSLLQLRKWKSLKARKVCKKRLIENAKKEFVHHLKHNQNNLHSVKNNMFEKLLHEPVTSLGRLLDLFYHLNGTAIVNKEARLLTRSFVKCYRKAKFLQKNQETLLSKKLIRQTAERMISICLK